ncbi:FlgK family flagellar hook-associated protein [Buchnera aphidicola]|uniref:FlgK family flagellar hook-associated protein n=1 Tax=Buchnera aphidicola TaxID=9 RepID=UPI003463B505
MYDINDFIINNIVLLNNSSKNYFNEITHINRINDVHYKKNIKYKIHKTFHIKINTNFLNKHETDYSRKLKETRKIESETEKNKIILNILTKIKNVFLKNQEILLNKNPFDNHIFLNAENLTSPIEKQEQFIDQLHELLDEYKFFYDNFLNIEKYISNKIQYKVNTINRIIDQIDLLNKQIQQAKINNKITYINIFNIKRDNLINQLNKIIAVHTDSQDSEHSVRIFDNILLVSDKLKYHIQNNYNKINRVEDRLCFVDKSSNTINIPLSQIIGGGEISGLATTYLDNLVPVINQIRQIIFDLSENLDIKN